MVTLEYKSTEDILSIISLIRRLVIRVSFITCDLHCAVVVEDIIKEDTGLDVCASLDWTDDRVILYTFTFDDEGDALIFQLRYME